MTKSILIVDAEAPKYRSSLKPSFPELDIRTASPGEVGSDIEEVAAIFAFGGALSDEIIRGAKNLRWIQFLSSGTDAVHQLKSLSRHVLVTSTHGVHGASVSEMVFLHMLVLARNYRRLLKNQEQAVWEEHDQPLLYGKTVAILGVGLIGQALGLRCHAFGMTVLGMSQTPRPVAGFDRILPRSALVEAAGIADFLVLLLPLAPETRGIIDRRVLRAMKPSAYLINVGRGGVCDEEALCAALREKWIAGAGLDVFAEEPLPREHPLWRMDGTVITPHVAGRSDNYAELVMPILRANLKCFLEGRTSEMLNLRPR